MRPPPFRAILAVVVLAVLAQMGCARETRYNIPVEKAVRGWQEDASASSEKPTGPPARVLQADLGGRKVLFPAPSGFVDARRLGDEKWFTALGSSNPNTALVCVFAPDRFVTARLAGKKAAPEQVASVSLGRAMIQWDAREADFADLAQKLRERLNVSEPAENGSEQAASLREDEVFLDTDRTFGWMRLDTHLAGDGDKAVAVPVLSANAIVLVRNRVVSLQALAYEDSPEHGRELVTLVRNWTRAMLRANR